MRAGISDVCRASAVAMLSLICLAWSSGCTDKRLPPKLKPEIRLINLPSAPIKVIVEGREIQTIEPQWDGFGGTREIALGKVVEPAAVKALILTPEGWSEEHTRISAGSSMDQPCCFVSFEFERDGRRRGNVRLYVDNRGGQATVLTCGELPMSVPANWSGSFLFLGPAKPSSSMIHLDKKQIGTLWPADEADAPELPSRIWLLDTSGQKTYVHREVVYELLSSAPERPSATIKNRFLHPLPLPPDYFLLPAPPSIKGSGAGPVTKFEVLEKK